MKIKKIGTFDELMALDPKQWKFSRVLSPEESRKVIEDSKKPLTLKEAYDMAEQEFQEIKAAHRKDKKDLQ